MTKKLTLRLTSLALLGCVVFGCLGNIGCQSTHNGQTLSSPHYLTDDIQYFPSGPEFPYTKEATQMERDQAERMQASRQQY